MVKAIDLKPGMTIRYTNTTPGAVRIVAENTGNTVYFTNGKHAGIYWLDELAQFEVIEPEDYVW